MKSPVGGAVNQLVVEGLIVLAAGRACVSSRPLELARPRRGSQDLPDRDAPERARPDAPDAVPAAVGVDRWILPASVGLAAMLGTVVARAAMMIV